jgi:hypothetical protein
MSFWNVGCHQNTWCYSSEDMLPRPLAEFGTGNVCPPHTRSPQRWSVIFMLERNSSFLTPASLHWFVALHSNSAFTSRSYWQIGIHKVLTDPDYTEGDVMLNRLNCGIKYEHKGGTSEGGTDCAWTHQTIRVQSSVEYSVWGRARIDA